MEAKTSKTSKGRNRESYSSSLFQGRQITGSMPTVHSHFLMASERLDKLTRRVIAPYAQIERKGLKKDEEKGTYLDINRFNVFLEDTVDLNSLLYETAMVLKSITNSTGCFVYTVNPLKGELIMMQQDQKTTYRNEINIPIGEGATAAGHAAFTKEYLLIDDVPRDTRFSEGLKWIEAKSALCMPVVKPDGECHAVLELYRDVMKPYDDSHLYIVLSMACWAGAAVHQAHERVSLQRKTHLNMELRKLLEKYFCDLASIDTMLTDMLEVIKSFLGAMRSTFYIIDKDHIGDYIQADMWDDGWKADKFSMPKKKAKVNLSQERSPAGMVAQTNMFLNVRDAYKDPRFSKDVDPTTGAVMKSCMVAPIRDKTGVIGVVQVTNKLNGQPFDSTDEQIYNVFVSYCSLIVHFYNMQQKKVYFENLRKVQSDLLRLHLRPCRHDIDELMETHGFILPPNNFKSWDYNIPYGSLEDMPGLVTYMFIEVFADRNFEKRLLASFTLTVLQCYRENPYHNAEHAFVFTHTMYMILVNNTGFFNFIETCALMLAGLCHDVDHPGVNNNFLSLCRHPLAQMYRNSTLEQHHAFLARKLVEDNNILAKLPLEDRDAILQEMHYAILCTDLAVYFQIRARLTPILAERSFDWTDNSHRKMLKGIMMTSADLSGSCKPFNISKRVAENIYEEFYNQGDVERGLGYTPLSMMDRRRSVNQPAEQIQFLSVVVLPSLMMLHSIFENTAPLIENCKRTQEAWREEIEIRGQKLWRQEESLQSSLSRKNKSDENTEKNNE